MRGAENRPLRRLCRRLCQGERLFTPSQQLLIDKARDLCYDYCAINDRAFAAPHGGAGAKGEHMAESKQIYIRFHEKVDEALTRGAEATGLRRATLVAWIIETFLRRFDEKCERGELTLQQGMTAESLGLSPLASVYALKLGRTTGHAPRAIGKAIILTLPPASERQMQLLARFCGMSANHFRSAVVASFLIEQGLLGEL